MQWELELRVRELVRVRRELTRREPMLQRRTLSAPKLQLTQVRDLAAGT